MAGDSKSILVNKLDNCFVVHLLEPAMKRWFTSWKLSKSELRHFETINNLSDNVMFVSDFNSKLEAFGCAKKNISGLMPKNIQSHLNLTYLDNDEHRHLDKSTGIWTREQATQTL